MQTDMTPTQLVNTLVICKGAAKLLAMAAERHGYENSDIGCGVQFNDDDTVYLYAGWDEFEQTIPVTEYLSLLSAHIGMDAG